MATRKGELPLGQRPHQGQPPVLPLAGEGGGVVEGEVPGAQHRDGNPGKGGQVPGQPCALGLVGADHHHRAPGNQADAGGDVAAVDGRRPGQGHRGAAPLQGGKELLKFRYAVQGGGKQFHREHLIFDKTDNAATPLPP